jgi:hypothetical protein
MVGFCVCVRLPHPHVILDWAPREQPRFSPRHSSQGILAKSHPSRRPHKLRQSYATARVTEKGISPDHDITVLVIDPPVVVVGFFLPS